MPTDGDIHIKNTIYASRGCMPRVKLFPPLTCLAFIPHILCHIKVLSFDLQWISDYGVKRSSKSHNFGLKCPTECNAM